MNRRAQATPSSLVNINNYYRNHRTQWNPPQQEVLALHLWVPPNQAVAATNALTLSAMNSYLLRPKVLYHSIPTRVPSGHLQTSRNIQHPGDSVPNDLFIYFPVVCWDTWEALVNPWRPNFLDKIIALLSPSMEQSISTSINSTLLMLEEKENTPGYMLTRDDEGKL